MRRTKKKRSVTLIEIMIVILLIGLIGGALAFNMRGSMDKGKVFKSEQNATRVSDILMMAYSEGYFDLSNIGNQEEVIKAIEKSKLVKDAKAIIKDGWGADLKIELKGGDEIVVYSEKAKAWQDAQNK